MFPIDPQVENAGDDLPRIGYYGGWQVSVQADIRYRSPREIIAKFPNTEVGKVKAEQLVALLVEDGEIDGSKRR